MERIKRVTILSLGEEVTEGIKGMDGLRGLDRMECVEESRNI